MEGYVARLNRRHDLRLRTVHEIFSFLWCPGLVIGGLLGVAVLLGVHWLLPDISPAISALMLVACSAAGVIAESFFGTRRKS